MHAVLHDTIITQNIRVLSPNKKKSAKDGNFHVLYNINKI